MDCCLRLIYTSPILRENERKIRERGREREEERERPAVNLDHGGLVSAEGVMTGSASRPCCKGFHF